MKKLMVPALLAILVMVLTGCGKVVPPGTTVVLLKPSGESTIFTKGAYFAYGRDKVYFVDTKLKSYPKELKILCADEINMDVSVKWVGSFKVTPQTMEVIKSKVPAKETQRGDMKGFELSLDSFYTIAMEDIVSSVTRGVVSPYKTDNIREAREEIRLAIKQAVLARIEELSYPVETADILITNLDYPPEVTAMRNKIKQAELKDLENAAIAKAEVAKAQRDAELAAEKGKAQLVTAQADSAANLVRAASLTPEIITIKQIEMLTTLAQGPNNTVVIMPYEALRAGMTDGILQREGIQELIDTVKAPTTPPVKAAKK